MFKRLRHLLTARSAQKETDDFGSLFNRFPLEERALVVTIAIYAWKYVGIGIGDSLDYAVKTALLFKADHPHPELLAEAQRTADDAKECIFRMERAFQATRDDFFRQLN
jgi:hypothetical protein